MTRLEELALVVQLASLTEDRDRQEQQALLAVARRVDREWNVQSLLNRRLDRGPHEIPCTYSTEHDKKTCPCRGDRMIYGVPRGGWSRLAAAVLPAQGETRSERGR